MPESPNAPPRKVMPELGRRYRLITRADMDGIACAALLRALGVVGAEGVTFAHPADMRCGLVPVGPGDIIANLPYVPGAALSFSTRPSDVEALGLAPPPAEHIYDPNAPSVAHVIRDHFGGEGLQADVAPAVLAAAARAKTADYTRAEVLRPEGWALIVFITDPRTGLGRFRDFNISNIALMHNLIEVCAAPDADAGAILALPDVAARVELYYAQQADFRAQVERCTTLEAGGRLGVLDLRREEQIWAGNRFMLYALMPQVAVSCHVFWGKSRQNTVLALGRSPFSARAAHLNLGDIARAHGGGGAARAGECQVDNARAEVVKGALIADLLAAL
jgi:nanoRNase/pAp phosphatase (c-di-AMP/oligoRNAs hydrolase)